jgi:hypothetical protein
VEVEGDPMKKKEITSRVLWNVFIVLQGILPGNCFKSVQWVGFIALVLKS